ncbi:transposase [Streptomyces sp. x-80]|uniref:transposase n=1 Tax=Streptomyces sp. x-80 TaxID=2789282 RepID=UPI0039803B82
MSEREPYPSDVSDERWVLIEPVPTARRAGRPSATGHEGRNEIRENVNAIPYQSRPGRQWARLPGDLPPSGAVHCRFGLWRDDGTDRTVPDLPRRQLQVSRRHRGPAPRWHR